MPAFLMRQEVTTVSFLVVEAETEAQAEEIVAQYETENNLPNRIKDLAYCRRPAEVACLDARDTVASFAGRCRELAQFLLHRRKHVTG